MPAADLTYPYAAVVDPGDMSLALVLSAVSPEIGGVLVRGEKGTAKSTIVRALAAVLPPVEVDGETRPVRLVELPVGATEDRVLGSLQLEKVLSTGEAEYEPGLLVKAHRGILYVDEVNLLHDHLVDVLLDAAAMGRCTVERDGISVSREARFVLVGTMNPEEGELRPQLLDRFGLTVEVAAPRDPALRVEVVRRRMAFDADPAAFAERFAAEQQALRDRLAAAQSAVASVELPDEMLLRIAELCAAFDVDGLRADLVTARAAVAHAAWEGRDVVTPADVRVAARLALPHRRRRNPFDTPGLDEETLDDVLGPEPEQEPDPEPDPDPDGPGPDGGGEPAQPAEAPPAGEGDSGAQPAPAPATAPTNAAAAGEPGRARLFTVAGTGDGVAGRRSRAVTSNGRRVGALRGGAGPVHLLETVRASLPHQVARGRVSGALRLQPADLRTAVREGREANLVLLCVDASGSMAARRRMEQVKTAVLSLLLDAYQRRDTVGLVTFRATGAELVLPPTRSVEIAARRLDEVPAGGRTPLAEGLLEAGRVVARERVRDPRRRPLLVVVTDGRATAGADPLPRAHRAAARLAEQGVAALVVDCEAGSMRLGLAGTLAGHLRADLVTMAEVTGDALAGVVRERVA